MNWLDYADVDQIMAEVWVTMHLIPRPARSLRPSPRHTPRALGQRAPKPTIRSWLGGRRFNPPPHPHWTLNLT